MQNNNTYSMKIQIKDAFLIPIDYDEESSGDWLCPSWTALGNTATIELQMNDQDQRRAIRRIGADIYRVNVADKHVYVYQEAQYGWTLAAQYYSPDATHITGGPIMYKPEQRFLQNAIWPLEAALKLSAWRGDECKHLCGLDDDGRLFLVANGEKTQELQRVDGILF